MLNTKEKYDIFYYDKETSELAHVEKGYSSYREAHDDAETYTYGYVYKIVPAN